MPSGIYIRTKSVWNKGRSWTEEERKVLSLAHMGKKQPHIGVPRTDETKRKISKAMTGHIKSLETRKKHSINMIYKMKNKIIKNKDTKPELITEHELKSRNINHIKQWKYELGIADFYLPEYNIVIEVDGKYWHNKPEVIERDIRKNEYLRNEGYKVFRFTDKEVLSDVKSCIDKVFT